MKTKASIHPLDINSEHHFGTFYSTYYARFYRYAFYYVSNQQTAEDITHDAILYYWENKDNLSSGADVLGYILLTIRNKCLNYLKHLKVETKFNEKYTNLYEWEVKARIMTLEEADYQEIFTNELVDLISASMKKLPRQTQYIFVQNLLHDKSRKELAVELGVSLQKIDYHINKAKEHLYKYLKGIYLFSILFLQKFF